MRYLYLALLIVAIAIAASVLELVFSIGGTSLTIHRESGAGLVILYVLVLAMLGLFAAFAAPIGFGSYARLYWANRGTAAFGFLAAFGFASVAVTILYAGLALTGHLTWSAEEWQRVAPRFANRVFVGLLTALLVAISEEIMFRGVMVSYLRWNRTRSVTVAAILVSALLFAIAHNIQNPLEWLTLRELPLFVGLTLLGIALAATYVATGSLWCSIGLHAGLLATGRVLPRKELVLIDFEPWWLGGTSDLRRAPLIWVFFIATTLLAFVARRWLFERFAVEPFVGMPDDKRAVPAKDLLSPS